MGLESGDSITMLMTDEAQAWLQQVQRFPDFRVVGHRGEEKMIDRTGNW